MRKYMVFEDVNDQWEQYSNLVTHAEAVNLCEFLTSSDRRNRIFIDTTVGMDCGTNSPSSTQEYLK